MKNFRFWETMVGDIMWLFKKKERVETQQTDWPESVVLTSMKESPSNIRHDEIDAYWMSGNPGAWHYNLWMLVVNGEYMFGNPVCKGKIRRTLRKGAYGWETAHQETTDEYSVVSDDAVFEVVKDVYCWIDTMEEWKSVSDDRYYSEVFVPKKIVAMLEGKYSESFSLLLASKSLRSRDLIQRAITLYEEGLSPDMRAYLLLVDNENKRTG